MQQEGAWSSAGRQPLCAHRLAGTAPVRVHAARWLLLVRILLPMEQHATGLGGACWVMLSKSAKGNPITHPLPLGGCPRPRCTKPPGRQDWGHPMLAELLRLPRCPLLGLNYASDRTLGQVCCHISSTIVKLHGGLRPCSRTPFLLPCMPRG